MKPQEITPAPLDSVIGLDAGEAVQAGAHGRRAADLARLTVLGLPVPPGIALSFDCVAALPAGGPMPGLPPGLADGGLLALRGSPGERQWGGPSAMLNLGACDNALESLASRFGEAPALRLYVRSIVGFGQAVHGLDPEDFEALGRRHLGASTDPDAAALRAMLAVVRVHFEGETGEPWPQDPAEQLEAAARAMARAWNAPTARILRRAKGAPEDAGLGLLVQRLAVGLAPGSSGAGTLQLVSARTGAPEISGTFFPRGQGPAAPGRGPDARPLTRAERKPPSLQEISPAALDALRGLAERATAGLADACQLDFVLENGRIAVLDALPVKRNARAAVRIAVDLAKAGVITRPEALLRIEPRSLIEHLHPQIDPSAVSYTHLTLPTN